MKETTYQQLQAVQSRLTVVTESCIRLRQRLSGVVHDDLTDSMTNLIVYLNLTEKALLDARDDLFNEHMKAANDSSAAVRDLVLTTMSALKGEPR